MSIVEKALGKYRDVGRRSTDLVDASRLVAAGAAVRARPQVVPRTYANAPIHVDIERMRNAGACPPADMEGRVAEEFRRIKWPVLAAAKSPATAGSNLVMVTSALSGDGKTFTAFNLALSIARERDCSVMLVDADMPKRHLTKLLGLGETKGLSDVLLDGKLDWHSAVFPTDIDGLTILPSGSHRDHTPELLASHRMQDVLAGIAADDPNQIIILDSAPLLMTNDSQVLSRLVAHVLVVVRANGTPKPAVEEAVGLLAEGKSVGLILNQLQSLAGVYEYYGEYYNNGAVNNEDKS